MFGASARRQFLRSLGLGAAALAVPRRLPAAPAVHVARWRPGGGSLERPGSRPSAAAGREPW